MKFAAASILAFASVGMADICTLVGYEWRYEDVIGGGANSRRDDNGFSLYYQGGKSIASCSYETDGPNCGSTNDHTISPGTLKLPNGLEWHPLLNGLVFNGCSGSYNGNSVDGITDPAINVCSSWDENGFSCSQCAIDFECEGGLV